MKWPKHHSLNLEHNGHKSYYMPIEDYLDRPHLEGDCISTEDRAKILETNEIWECQLYPITPISFIHIVVPTWERLVEVLNAIGKA